MGTKLSQTLVRALEEGGRGLVVKRGELLPKPVKPRLEERRPAPDRNRGLRLPDLAD